MLSGCSMFKLGECSVWSCLLNARALLITKNIVFHIKCVTWWGMGVLLTLCGIFRFLNWQSLQHGSTHTCNTSSNISPRLILDVKYGLFDDKNSWRIVKTIYLNIDSWIWWSFIWKYLLDLQIASFLKHFYYHTLIPYQYYTLISWYP